MISISEVEEAEDFLTDNVASILRLRFPVGFRLGHPAVERTGGEYDPDNPLHWTGLVIELTPSDPESAVTAAIITEEVTADLFESGIFERLNLKPQPYLSSLVPRREVRI